MHRIELVRVVLEHFIHDNTKGGSVYSFDSVSFPLVDPVPSSPSFTVSSVNLDLSDEDLGQLCLESTRTETFESKFSLRQN